jgi:glycosyltransferase involved in cell wall biosynthesis
VKITALIPTYNRRTEVLRAIDSVLAQTVPVDEIIVVDDGSTDGSAEAIRNRYGARVTLFQQENAGVSAARNVGILEARGEWVAFLDSDDIWFPTKIERQIEALAALGDGFGMCFTDCVYGGNDDLKQSVFQEMGFDGAPRFGAVEQPMNYMLEGREPFLFPSSMIVLNSLLKEIGGFDEALLIGEDTDVLFQLSFRTGFCFASETLVQIDRTPSREVGLLNLYSMRDDRKYDTLERRYIKWLSLPVVADTEYEEPVREMLRTIYFDSAAAKIHDLRIGPAFREINRLRAMGDSYAAIIGTLMSNRIAKLGRGFGAWGAGATPPTLLQDTEDDES